MSIAYLSQGENIVLNSKIAKFLIDGKNTGKSGTLIITNRNRLVFLINPGTIDHSYDLLLTISCYFERRIMSKKLLIEWADYSISNSSHVYSYEGINDPELWVSTINNIVTTSRNDLELEGQVIDKINSKRNTAFSELMLMDYFSNEVTYEKLIEKLQEFLDDGLIGGYIDEESKEFVNPFAPNFIENKRFQQEEREKAQREQKERDRINRERVNQRSSYNTEEESYSILGVSRNANEAQVKDAWRELVKKWHPHTVKDQSVQEDPRVKEEFSIEFDKIMKAYERIKKEKGWR
jgi:hypothetical protein